MRAYIIDTGIRTAHDDFGGRASVGYDALGGSGQDCNGHGTHVAGTVDADYHPDGTYYYSGVSGTHSGWLSGPADADFDLYLYKWTIFGWWPVASSYSPTSEEQISYSGTSGYYTWRVDSYSGSGAYDFWLQRP